MSFLPGAAHSARRVERIFRSRPPLLREMIGSSPLRGSEGLICFRRPTRPEAWPHGLSPLSREGRVYLAWGVACASRLRRTPGRLPRLGICATTSGGTPTQRLSDGARVPRQTRSVGSEGGYAIVFSTRGCLLSPQGGKDISLPPATPPRNDWLLPPFGARMGPIRFRIAGSPLPSWRGGSPGVGGSLCGSALPDARAPPAPRFLRYYLGMGIRPSACMMGHGCHAIQGA